LISAADVFEAVSRGKSDPGLAAISPDLRHGDTVREDRPTPIRAAALVGRDMGEWHEE
jgi:hypothetical protein